MRKTLVIAVMFAASVFAADAPKKPVSKRHALSAEFSKAAVKAVIALKHGEGIGATSADKALADAAMNEAEAASTTNGDSDAYILLLAFKLQCWENGIKFQTRVHAASIALLGSSYSDDERTNKAIFTAGDDPETVKEFNSADTCGQGLIKMLRSGNYSIVPQCDQLETVSAK